MNKKLKRILSAAAIAAAVTAVGATSAFAAGTGAGRNFTDTNGDNICDNCAVNQTDCILQNGTGKNYADTDHDGICDRTGRRFTDADGDGVCDHAAGQGLRQGKGFRGGRGR